MSWYAKYLDAFEKPFDKHTKEFTESIRAKLLSVQSGNPLVSVVIIAYNEEKRLLACLWSLSENICKYPFEIIGVNNNSRDDTAGVYISAGIRFFNETQKGPGFARNRGLSEAKGKYIVCIDADTIYPPYYIQTMTDALLRKGVVAAYSLWSYVPDAGYSPFKLFFYEMVRDVHLLLLSRKSPERCVRGMVFAHDAALAKEIGYKNNIIRGEDGSLAYKLKEHGKVVMVTSKKARPVTSTSTLKADGSLGSALVKRALSALKGFRKYLFKTKGDIEDQDSNTIK